MTISELIRTKRATRQFTHEGVSEETIRAILDAGRRAQSAKNTQPWQFVVLRDREVLRRLAECGKYADHLPDAAFAIALVAPTTTGFDMGQAAAYMQLAAWDKGIGSCITTMHYAEQAKAVLGIPENMHFEIVLAFGYPQPQQLSRPPRKGARKPLEEMVHWERW